MPPKASQSLEELQAQARRNFRYWPIYLMLRLREVEQHLAPTERAKLDLFAGIGTELAPEKISDLDIGILLEYGLLAGDEAFPKIDIPNPTLIPEAQNYGFRVGMSLVAGQLKAAFQSLDFVAFLPNSPKRLELLRVPASEAEQLNLAAALFSEMQAELSAAVALEAARFWAALHGARLLAWETLPNNLLSDFLPSEIQSFAALETNKLNPLTKLLPPRRKRGKGVFRDPN